VTDLTLDSVRDLVEEYGALQHPAEALNLLRFLGQNPPSLIIEVGVWRGGNAALLGTFFPDARIIGVDVLGPDDPDEDFVFRAHDIGSSPSLRTVVDRFGIEMVKGDSGDPEVVAQVRSLVGPTRADYLFIDAAHDYDSVKRDFELYSPLARAVGFHDVHNPAIFPFWLELTRTTHGDRSYALWKETDGHGIGVLLT